MTNFESKTGTISSEDGTHVYVRWFAAAEGGKGTCTVIGLHPEGTSAENMDDTTRICHEFAVKNNYETLAIVNLYSQFGLDQNNIRKADAPIGPENDSWVTAVAEASSMIIVAWGDFPWIKFRSRQLMNLLLPYTLHAVQVNSNGTPSHPKSWRLKAAKVYRQGQKKTVPAAG